MVFQSQLGAETMTTVNNTTTPAAAPLGNLPATTSNTSLGRLLRTRILRRRYPALTISKPTTTSTALERQQAIENALSAALWHIRHGDTLAAIQTATGRAIRAVSMLKQACEELATSEVAA
jgi:hypothetical protein